MENRSWLVQSKQQRDAALYALKQKKYRVGRLDNFAGQHELSVEAAEDEWHDVERIIVEHAPSAVPNR